MKNMKIKQKGTTDIYRHNFKNFNKIQFESELCNVDWKSVLEINKKMLIFHSVNFLKRLITSYKNMLQ